MLNPTLSIFLAGVGSALLCVSLYVKIAQILENESSYLHKWASSTISRLSSVSYGERWQVFRETSLTWFVIKILFFVSFLLPPLFLVAMTIYVGGWAFWGWLLEGGDMTYGETFSRMWESVESRFSRQPPSDK